MSLYLSGQGVGQKIEFFYLCSRQRVGGCSSAPRCCAAEPHQLILVPARLSRSSRHTFLNLCARAAEPQQI